MFTILKNIFFKEQIQKLSLYGFGQLFNLLTPLVVAPYIIAVCGEENYGKTAVAMAISFFLIVFVDFGSELTGVREIAINRENTKERNNVFSKTYSLKFLILLLVLVLAIVSFLFFDYFSKNSLVFLLSLAIVIGQFLNPSWFLLGLENIKYVTYYNILSKIIYVVLVFGFIKTKQDYVYINLFWGIGMIVSSFLILFFAIKKYNFVFQFENWNTIKLNLKSDFSIFVSQVFTSLQLYAPVVLVSVFGNNVLAGQYRIVEQVVVIFRTYILLFFNYTYPRICYLLSVSKQQGIQSWKQFHISNFVLIATTMLFIYHFSFEIIHYFTPNDANYLSKILKLAVFIPLLFAISTPLKQLTLAFNFNRYYVNVIVASVVISLALLVLMLPKFQLKGVIYSLCIGELFGIILYIYKLIKSKENDTISNPK